MRLEDERVYVIKTVRIMELGVEEQKAAINEVKILADLDSPFVVKYYGTLPLYSIVSLSFLDP